MRRRFGMLMGAFVTIVGLSLIAPEQSALARRGCGGRHHRKRNQCCGVVYQCCGQVNYCGSGCGYGGCGTAGGGYGAAGGHSGYGGGMSGPTPAPGGGTEAPAPPAPGT